MKQCNECKKEKEEIYFKKYNRNGITKLSNICKSCSSMERRVKAKNDRQANPTCNHCKCVLDSTNWTAHMKKESCYVCKPCHRNRPSQSFEANKDSTLKRKYGICLEQFNALAEKQGGRCAICKKEEVFSTKQGSDKMSLAVDHCHSTGKVRGLLCLKCNRALGLFEENIESLKEAIAYVKKHKDGH